MRHVPSSTWTATPGLRASLLCLFMVVALLASHADAGPVTLNPNGGWCWFEDERAIVEGDKLIVGSVKSPEGDIEVTTWDLTTGATSVFTLHVKLQSDDHASPAFLRLPDGRILAAYGRHGSDRFMRWRITSKSGATSAWEPEQTLDAGAGYTYSNLFRLSAENGRIYDFHRGVGFNPNYLVSEDDGKTFRYGGRLLTWPRPNAKQDPKATGLGGGGRPYVKYASNNTDTIHFLTTDDHPRNYDNSIYHGFVRGGNVCRSDGTVVAPLSTTKESSIKPSDLTCVFRGDADSVAWTIDMHLDEQSRPYAVFSVQKDGAASRTTGKAGGQDHRYYYARWDGAKWNVHEMAFAGTCLYAREADYTGLAALHPHDPNTVFISTNADPKTGKPLVSTADGKRHWEIFRGVTADGGATWTWTAVTRNSTEDNLRPIVPAWEKGRTALLWLRGTYRTYTSYDLAVVGIIDPK